MLLMCCSVVILVLLRSARWLFGKDAKSNMDADLEAWYPFAITDAATRVLVDSKGLPTECDGLAGKLVEIGAAMQAVEIQAGACNPNVSHHKCQKNASGPRPCDVNRGTAFQTPAFVGWHAARVV